MFDVYVEDSEDFPSKYKFHKLKDQHNGIKILGYRHSVREFDIQGITTIYEGVDVLVQVDKRDLDKRRYLRALGCVNAPNVLYSVVASSKTTLIIKSFIDLFRKNNMYSVFVRRDSLGFSILKLNIEPLD